DRNAACASGPSGVDTDKMPAGQPAYINPAGLGLDLSQYSAIIKHYGLLTARKIRRPISRICLVALPYGSVNSGIVGYRSDMLAQKIPPPRIRIVDLAIKRTRPLVRKTRSQA